MKGLGVAFRFGVIAVPLGAKLEQYKINTGAESFVRNADILIRQQKYGDVQKLSEHLSEQVKKTSVVSLVLTKAEVEEFLQKADALIRLEKYGDVQKLSESLSEQARKTSAVDLALNKASVFKTAFDQQDYELTDRATLVGLETKADFLEDSEKTAQTACLVGVIQNLLDNPTRAIQYFQLAQTRDDRYANLYSYWGRTMARWQVSDDSEPWAAAAERKFKEAAQLSQTYEWPFLNLGILTINRVEHPSIIDYENANKYFEKAEKIGPANPNAYMDAGAALTMLGVLYQKDDPTRATEYLGKASESFRRAYQLGLDSAPLHSNWGYLFELTGSPSNALGQYEMALKLKPKYPTACIRRAALLIQSQVKLAKESYAKCRDSQLEIASSFRLRAGVAPDPKSSF